MSISDRYYRDQGKWRTPSKRPLTDREIELLNEIELLKWELETVRAEHAMTRVDL